MLELLAAAPIYVRVVTNNRIHLRYQIGDRTVDDGRCGIDDNWVEASASDVESADLGRFCRYCFPVETGEKEAQA